MQLNTFMDDKMKILYTLSFMWGGMAQVWAVNETSAILDNTPSFSTLAELLASIERTFGNPDWDCPYTATHTQYGTGYDGRGIHSQF